ncbi:MAG: HAMP domain-containing histidine kinase [Solirubrobacterales bacterium]|nr:HAMP domain-containing histidine kinase [Solirubrobacterales bacterium]
MRARPWTGAFGLRARIVGVVLVTTVATLAVAAVALLGPLETTLRNANKKTLERELKGVTATFSQPQLDPALVSQRTITVVKPSRHATDADLQRYHEELQIQQDGRAAYEKLLIQQRAVAARIGATDVTLLGYPDHPSGPLRPIVVWPPDSDVARADSYSDASEAFHTGRAVYGSGTIGGTEYARAALPFTTRSPVGALGDPDGTATEHWILAVRVPLGEVIDAVSAVRRAFLTAALAGLALTLLLGIPLSARLVRRLRRLRQAALRLAVEGPDAEVPEDRAHDEVGDLARTFATMQRRLQQQERARRAFVATASHELRTPLQSLDGMLELVDEDLRSGEPDLEDALSLLGRARDQSRRLGRLAADLLDLSRLDAEVQLRSEPVEFGELSRAVLAEFELGTAERGIVTGLDDSPGPVWALGDPGSVARILRILMDNAVRMTPEGGEIAVELHDGPQPSLGVRDTGPGVAPDERELIFERFKRGRDTAGRAGFGLGLAIGRELARRMGGDLVLEDRPGPGATFTLRLPAAAAPAEQPVGIL